MRTVKAAGLCLLLCLALCAAPGWAEGIQTPAVAEEPAANSPATITAMGSATVSLTPDSATLTVGVTATAATVTEAQDAVAAKLDTLREALKPLGVDGEDVYTIYYTAETVYNYQYGKLGDTESLAGYRVNSNVAVYVRSAGGVGAVIDAALQNGAESSYELAFESSRQQEAYDQAMQSAAANAMRKAKLLAQSSGLELGALVSVREKDEGAQDLSEMESLSGGQTEGGLHSLLKVNATVEVTYQVK